VDPNVLYAQLVVLLATVGAAGYWWWSLVPTLRRNLAKEKRQGALNEYLVDLQQNDEKKLEQWFYTDWLKQLQRRQEMAQRAAAKRAAVGEPGSTQQEQQQQQGEFSPESRSASQIVTVADPHVKGTADHQGDVPSPLEEQQQGDGDKEPFFWSLDNPIMATAAGLAAIALVSSLLHKT
jgi:hypothetical protein